MLPITLPRMFSCNNFPTRKNKTSRILFFLSCATLLAVAGAYNFDTEHIIVFDDPKSFRSSRGSYFGFSVALYAGLGNDFEDASVLVGAPRANVSAIASVLEPGTVYKCPLNGTCVEWNLDTTKNEYVENRLSTSNTINRKSKINQIKDHAWIGGAIGVENSSQPKVVVCAPHWKNNVTIANHIYWYINGACYWSTVPNSTAFDERADSLMSPTLGRIPQAYRKFYNYAMSEAGFSLHMFTDRGRSKLLLGAPGIYDWKGAPLLSDYNDREILPNIGGESRIQRNAYFGYSVTSGHYVGQTARWYASGAPRGNNLMGRVLIYRFPSQSNQRLDVIRVLDGKQYGEYFGASLASCDVNNDGTDDLVVGAPLWTKDMDEGRVYTYINNRNADFKPQYIEGEVTGARFGSMVTCLGDLDNDGYGDIAVGAPYENDHGAVYIYNGNANGLSKRYSQRIAGETVSVNIRGFGAAISEPRDVDGNGYADVAIGAYGSGHVALLRSRPVVTMRVSAVYVANKELRSNSTFFTINICVFYDGVKVPEKLSVEKILKVDALRRRAFYGNDRKPDGTYHLPDTLRSGKNTCDEMRINLVPGIQNIIEPVKISVSVALANRSGNDTFCSSCPIINRGLSKIEDSLTLSFTDDCGPDNVCMSLLDLAISGDLEDGNRYTLGSKPTVRLTVGVSNRGEPAYTTEARILVPSPISLGGVPPECAENHRSDGILEVICGLGNPLREQEVSIIELDMSRVRSNTKHMELSAKVSTKSVNLNSANHTRNLTIYFDVDADIAIAGKSQQDLYSYVNKEEEKRLETIKFQHIYEVQKFGKSPIEESILTVLVPTHWRDKGDVIEIASIYKTFGLMEGERFYCKYSNRTIDDEAVDDNIPTDLRSAKNTSTTEGPNNPRKGNYTFEPFNLEENSTMSVPPENRTLYLNCTNSAVECTRISCKLGTFASFLTVAKLTVTLEIQLRNFRDETMEAKDIILFVSDGSIAIVEPKGFVQRAENKPDRTLVRTTFVGSPVASRIAIWIIVLSVLLGILLLLLITLGLVKLGFFHRKKREELEALKAESDAKGGFVLETTSSRECLDQD